MSGDESEDISRWAVIRSLFDVLQFSPKLLFTVIIFGFCAAILEGVGLGFIIPIVELIRAGDMTAQADGVAGIFLNFYQTFGIPFTLGYAIVGISAILTVRYTLSFAAGWFREALRYYYIRDLQIRALDNALRASIKYYDYKGSDDIMNTIVTQTLYAGRAIARVIKFIQSVLLCVVYLLVALTIAPMLTLIAAAAFGGVTYLIRFIFESGYELGDKVADANERRQETAQAGTQGIKDIRMFNLTEEVFRNFTHAVNDYTSAYISVKRNETGIKNFHDLLSAICVFFLIYLSLTFANLSFASLAVFLFAIFRLGPRVSNLNRIFYQIENDLPHLVRTLNFIQNIKNKEQHNGGSRRVPQNINRIEFNNIWFSYDEKERVLCGIDFTLRAGEFVAFAGQSGAGKSTIVSLLCQLRQQNRGEIRVNDIPVNEMDIDEWRDRIALVRQDPFIFNDTLRYNLTIGNRDATREDIRRVCKAARIDEFFNDLHSGYKTVLGDSGVRLSGGQKQRVAIARALLKDADLLILDEATSDLDSSLERDVQDAIENMEQNYTIVAIAHQLSTVKNADRIYTIEDGDISECGTHGDLIEKGGTYADLYNIQASQ